jgi:hypothetical protein
VTFVYLLIYTRGLLTSIGRDEKLLECSKQYAEAVFGAAAMISIFPAWIRRIVGPLIAMPAQHYLSSCRKSMVPFVESRLNQTRESKSTEVRMVRRAEVLRLAFPASNENLVFISSNHEILITDRHPPDSD